MEQLSLFLHATYLSGNLWG